jgi:DNA polymerase-3 subunit beta
MQIIVNRNDLNQAVSITSKASSSKDLLEVLGGLLLEVSDNVLTITGSNLDLSIQAQIDCETEEEGSVILPAPVFSDIVRKADIEKISLKVDYNNYRTAISGDRFKMELAGLPGIEFPEVTSGEYEKGFSISSDLLASMLNYTVYAAAKDDMRPIFTGILLELKEDEITISATDGFRITSITRDILYKGPEKRIVLPGNNAHEILRLIQSSDTEEVIFNFGSGQVALNIDGIKVYSKLIEGQYPDIIQYLPNDYHSTMHVSRSSLDQSLERASLIVRDIKKGVVNLNCVNDTLTINARATDLGQHTEIIAVDLKGQEIKVSFTLRYLRELVKHNEDDTLVMQFAEKYNMLVAKPENDERCFSLLMPVAGRD